MKLDVLVSTMNQPDYNLVTKMNLESNAIIINQSNRNEIRVFSHRNKKISFMSFKEKGVGLSRNNALMRSKADICLMADDDMVYVPGYEKTVLEAFNKRPKADIILFNVPIHKKDGKTIVKVKKNGRVRIFNSLKYGTVNIAFRRSKIIKKNIFFSLLFGGGAKYGSGEDTLFIVEALKNKLKIHTSTEIIANIKENESTWFNGYNKQYFFDKGALFESICNSPLSYMLMIQFLLRKRKIYSPEISAREAFLQMKKGRLHFKKC